MTVMTPNQLDAPTWFPYSSSTSLLPLFSMNLLGSTEVPWLEPVDLGRISTDARTDPFQVHSC